MNALSFRSARVELGGRPVWTDVNLEIPEHEFVAILGPNGAGKSTLLNAILGLVPLTAGELFVNGREPGVTNHDIGYLPQRRSFDPTVRIRGIDVVRLGLDGDRYGIPLPGARSRRERERVDELI
jgi:zinc/manganese transport system ATP-binding protein